VANVIEFSIHAIDKFSANMDKLHVSMSKAESMFAGVGIAAATYVAIRSVQHSLDNADAMNAAAEKAGILTEELSALAYAGKLSNTELGSITTGLKMLNRSMAEGEATPGGRALQQLGVSAVDANGKMRGVIDVLLDVSDVFQGAANDAYKTKAALDVFSRSGVDMVPLLNRGGKAIRELMEDAKAFGQVIDGDFANAADSVNDNMSTLSAVLSGTVNQAMVQLAPVLQEVTGEMIQMAREGDIVKEMGQVVADTMRVMVSGAIIAAESFKLVGNAFGNMLVLLQSDNLTETWNLLKLGVVDATDTIGDAMFRVNNVWDESARKAAAGAAAQANASRKLLDSIKTATQASENQRSAQLALQKSIDDTVLSTQASMASSGLASELTKLMEFRLKGATEAQLKHYEALVGSKLSQDEWNKAQEDAAALIESQKTPLETFQDRIKLINTLHQEGALSAAEYTQAIEREQDAFGNAGAAAEEYAVTATSVMDETVRQIREGISSLGNEVFQVSSMLSDVLASAVRGVGDAVAMSIVDSKDLGESLMMVAKMVARTVISTLVQIGAQRLILAALDKTVTATGNAQKLGAAMSEVYTNSFASAAAIPVIGWTIAPGVAAANTALAAAGAATSKATGAAIGVAHGGLSNVPAESTYLLAAGERVLSPNQNQDLTSFLDSGSGGMSIGSITIHVLENATNTDAFARMDKMQLRSALGQPIIDALNEMRKIGVSPDYVTARR